MSRVSHHKLILDELKYKELKASYNQLINKLTDTYHQVVHEDNASLVNFKLNSSRVKHQWFKYKEGYSSILVEKIITKIKELGYMNE